MDKIRPAGGVIPVCKNQVYLVQRSSQGSFFPGYHAFPGGARELGDQEQADADKACAVRELFEEVGAWPGPQNPGPQRRRDLLDGKLTFAALAAEFPVEWERLIPAGMRLTPDYSAIRFAAQFYLLEIDGEFEVWPGELSSGAWWDVKAAYAAWQRSEIFLAPPTQFALARLIEFGREDAARVLQSDPPNVGDYIPVCPELGYVPLVTPTLPPARHTMCYLLRDVVIDPGSSDPEQLLRLEEVLKTRAIQPRAVLFSHHHPDHVGGLHWAQERGYPIWMHPRTAYLLQVEAEAPPALDGVAILHTPGHASGHLALWLQERSILLAHDLVSSLSTILVHLPDGDMGQYLDSLRGCIELEPRLVLPSHGGPMGPGSDLLGKTLRHRLQREEKVLQALAEEPADLDDLLARAYDDTPVHLMAVARWSLEAHLEKLRQEGRFLGL